MRQATTYGKSKAICDSAFRMSLKHCPQLRTLKESEGLCDKEGLKKDAGEKKTSLKYWWIRQS